MLLKELLSIPRPVIKHGEENHFSLIRDVIEAIESSCCYPWNVKLDQAYAFSDDEEFNSRIGVKDISSWHFQSDEDALLRVIVFDNKDIAYASKSGDTRYWYWKFYSNEDMVSFLGFLRQVNDRLSNMDFEADCVIDFEKDTYDTPYLELDVIDGEVYVDNFQSFAWALEPFNHPKKAYLKENTENVEVEVVEWVQEDSTDKDPVVKINLNNKTISYPLSALRFKA